MRKIYNRDQNINLFWKELNLQVESVTVDKECPSEKVAGTNSGDGTEWMNLDPEDLLKLAERLRLVLETRGMRTMKWVNIHGYNIIRMKNE